MNRLPSLANGTMDLGTIIRHFEPDLGPLEQLYKDIHQHPELSRREARTAAVITSRLRQLDFDVHNGIGGYGVVGVLQNGLGPVVLLRAELDALPIKERTELPFSSTRYMKDWWGYEQPVMHACGHDMHMACLMGAAELLQKSRSEWTGTLTVLFQPNEEHTGGAQAMVDDNLYDKIQKPDVIMAQHIMQIPSGSISVKKGPVLVSADTVQIRIYSSRGHPANPQVGVDVVVVASKIILKLQNLAHRVGKEGYASIHTEEIHAGQTGADCVSHADIVLDVKAYDPAIRSRLLDGITEVVEEEAAASGADKMPRITSSVRAPATSNDGWLAAQMQGVFSEFFGPQNVVDDVPSHPCEDFSILATAIGAPYLFWFIGKVDPEALDRAREDDKILDLIPIEHSPFNAPLIRPTLETGIRTLSLAALHILKDGIQSST